jgi:hypothetical protein
MLLVAALNARVDRAIVFAAMPRIERDIPFLRRERA